MTLQIYTNLHHFKFKSQHFSGDWLLAFSWTSPSIFARFPPSIRVSPSDIGPSVYSRLSALGNHISGGGGEFDAFFIFVCVYCFGCFSEVGIWDSGVNPRENSWN